MASMHRQSGLTLISWMVVIAVVAFFAVVGLKSLPIYLNHYKIVSIMQNVAGQPGISESSPLEIRETFSRRFDIDMVKHVDEREIKVKGAPGGPRTMELKYEVRIKMFYNVDAVFVFDEKVPLKS